MRPENVQSGSVFLLVVWRAITILLVPGLNVSKFISPSTKLLGRKIEAIPTKCQAVSLGTFDFHNKQNFPSFGGCLKEKFIVFIFFFNLFHVPYALMRKKWCTLECGPHPGELSALLDPQDKQRKRERRQWLPAGLKVTILKLDQPLSHSQCPSTRMRAWKPQHWPIHLSHCVVTPTC